MMRSMVLMIVLAAACGGQQQSTESLAESIRSYNEGVRWGRFDNAASRIPAPERAAFVDEMDERADDLKITEYDVVKVDRKGAREAKVQIKMSWYLDSEGTLRETHAIQTWARRGKIWLMVDELRLRGAQMPGLAEPLEPAEQAEPAEHTDGSRAARKSPVSLAPQ